jgi:hypothetical protein
MSPTASSGSTPAATKPTLKPTPDRKEQARRDLERRQSGSFSSVLRENKSGSSYLPPSTLSLVLSGAEQKHLQKHLSSLVIINKKQKVKIGEVLVVGDVLAIEKLKASGQSKEVSQKFQQELNNSEFRTIDELYEFIMLHGKYTKYPALVGLTHSEMKEAKRVLDFYQIESSPTWIVRHLGRDYVFEGFEDPFSLFNNRGEFIRADY